MTQVQLIERQVARLNGSTLAAFRNWFRKFDALYWDHQIRTDARIGKLEKLAKEALAEHKSRKMKKYKLDKEEQEILDAIESGAWELVKPKKSQLEHYAAIARNTLRKDQRMNIRISKADMNGLKMKAAEEGIPYQTLVAGVLHKYVSGTPIAA